MDLLQGLKNIKHSKIIFIYTLIAKFYVFGVEFGSLTTAQLREKVRGLQNLAYQLGLEEGMYYRMYLASSRYTSNQNILLVYVNVHGYR